MCGSKCAASRGRTDQTAGVSPKPLVIDTVILQNDATVGDDSSGRSAS